MFTVQTLSVFNLCLYHIRIHDCIVQRWDKVKIRLRLEFLYLGMIEKHNPVKVKIQVQWLPPPVNWVKLNSDGPSMGNPGLAGGGGLIRNERGE